LNWSKKTDLVAEINITNLVDVALTVLVIFMIAAPMMTPGIDVNLPRTDASLPHDQEGITVSIKDNREVYIDSNRVGLADLSLRLEAILKNKPPGIVVYIRADKSVDYGYVIDIVGRIRKAGIKELGLVAEIPEK
jgi:biopolymer transport protein TolR